MLSDYEKKTLEKKELPEKNFYAILNQIQHDKALFRQLSL